MKRSEFDNLNFMEQVQYVNKKLLEGTTITNICKSIGVGRSTVRDRFEKAGYKYKNEVKQYQSYIEIVDHESSNSVVEAFDVVEDSNVQASSNAVVGMDIQYTDIQYRYEDLTKIIENYNSLNDKMNEMYNWYKLQNSNDVVEANRFVIKEFKGDTVARSFKLYDSVQKDFMKFCKKNNKYKVQDILSTLLDEAMKKYK